MSFDDMSSDLLELGQAAELSESAAAADLLPSKEEDICFWRYGLEEEGAMSGRILRLIDHVASFTRFSPENGYERRPHSREEVELKRWLREVAVEFEIGYYEDEVGNFFMYLVPDDLSEREHIHIVANGSHFDAALPAGKFDGVLGWINALLTLLWVRNEVESCRIKLTQPYIVMILQGEESSFFPPFLGTDRATGPLSGEHLEARAHAGGEGYEGRSHAELIVQMNRTRLEEALAIPDDFLTAAGIRARAREVAYMFLERETNGEHVRPEFTRVGGVCENAELIARFFRAHRNEATRVEPLTTTEAVQRALENEEPSLCALFREMGIYDVVMQRISEGQQVSYTMLEVHLNRLDELNELRNTYDRPVFAVIDRIATPIWAIVESGEEQEQERARLTDDFRAYCIAIEGHSAHAGTEPLDKRADTILELAYVISYLEGQTHEPGVPWAGIFAIKAPRSRPHGTSAIAACTLVYAAMSVQTLRQLEADLGRERRESDCRFSISDLRTGTQVWRSGRDEEYSPVSYIEDENQAMASELGEEVSLLPRLALRQSAAITLGVRRFSEHFAEDHDFIGTVTRMQDTRATVDFRVLDTEANLESNKMRLRMLERLCREAHVELFGEDADLRVGLTDLKGRRITSREFLRLLSSLRGVKLSENLASLLVSIMAGSGAIVLNESSIPGQDTGEMMARIALSDHPLLRGLQPGGGMVFVQGEKECHRLDEALADPHDATLAWQMSTEAVVSLACENVWPDYDEWRALQRSLGEHVAASRVRDAALRRGGDLLRTIESIRTIRPDGTMPDDPLVGAAQARLLHGVDRMQHIQRSRVPVLRILKQEADRLNARFAAARQERDTLEVRRLMIEYMILLARLDLMQPKRVEVVQTRTGIENQLRQYQKTDEMLWLESLQHILELGGSWGREMAQYWFTIVAMLLGTPYPMEDSRVMAFSLANRLFDNFSALFNIIFETTSQLPDEVRTVLAEWIAAIKSFRIPPGASIRDVFEVIDDFFDAFVSSQGRIILLPYKDFHSSSEMNEKMLRALVSLYFQIFYQTVWSLVKAIIEDGQYLYELRQSDTVPFDESEGILREQKVQIERILYRLNLRFVELDTALKVRSVVLQVLARIREVRNGQHA